jgi:hypothetical protein
MTWTVTRCYPEESVEGVPKSIGLTFGSVGEESELDEPLDGVPCSESDSSDVEKSVTSEH